MPTGFGEKRSSDHCCAASLFCDTLFRPANRIATHIPHVPRLDFLQSDCLGNEVRNAAEAARILANISTKLSKKYSLNRRNI